MCGWLQGADLDHDLPSLRSAHSVEFATDLIGI
jgi:hypothetical protein